MDLCQKYNQDELFKESHSLFLNKLIEKKQNNYQQKQAVNAITIFYELKSSDNVKRNAFKNKNEKISSGKYAPKLTNIDW